MLFVGGKLQKNKQRDYFSLFVENCQRAQNKGLMGTIRFNKYLSSVDFESLRTHSFYLLIHLISLTPLYKKTFTLLKIILEPIIYILPTTKFGFKSRQRANKLDANSNATILIRIHSKPRFTVCLYFSLFRAHKTHWNIGQNRLLWLPLLQGYEEESIPGWLRMMTTKKMFIV